jgi:hypothetical protein
MERKELNIIIAVAVVVAISLGVLGGGLAWLTVFRALKVQHAQLAEIQAELRGNGIVGRFHSGPMPAPWTPNSIAAADSVEGQLRAQGKHWVQTTGEITVGAYVEDILENRMGQIEGRGRVGKVLVIGPDAGVGPMTAQVDFNRGVVQGIHLSELSLIRFVPEDANAK